MKNGNKYIYTVFCGICYVNLPCCGHCLVTNLAVSLSYLISDGTNIGSGFLAQRITTMVHSRRW